MRHLRLIQNRPPRRPMRARLAIVESQQEFFVLFMSGALGGQSVIGKFQDEADAVAYAVAFAAETGIGRAA